jgi:hypothetical protein
MMADIDAHLTMLFDSIHHVLAAEKAFKEHGLWHDLIPVPRSLSSDCQMALEFNKKDVACVALWQRQGRLKIRSIFQNIDGAYVDVTNELADNKPDGGE